MALCPRCNKNDVTDCPATSRMDNSTLVCPRCGTAEAMEQFFYGGMLTPWYLVQQRGEDKRVADFMAVGDTYNDEQLKRRGEPDAG